MYYRAIYVFFILLILCTVGCANTRGRFPSEVQVNVNQRPEGSYISLSQDNCPLLRFHYKITEADKQSGVIQLPALFVRKTGYIPYRLKSLPVPIKMDLKSNEFFDFTHRGEEWAWYYKESIHLVRDPSYDGSRSYNNIELTVNSEPRGARVYQDGKFCGITPFVLTYDIQAESYRTGIQKCPPLTAAHDSCLPAQQEIEFQISPNWRYEKHKDYKYATLIILKRDPDYKPPTIVNQYGSGSNGSKINLNVKQEKDVLDVLQQTGTIISIFQSLKPLK